MRHRAQGRNYQSGAALLEFSLVLPLLIMLLIGVIYYGTVFLLDAAVTHAAKQGAIAAVAVDPLSLSSQGYKDAVEIEVGGSVRNSLSWLPANVLANITLPPTVTFLPNGGGQPGEIVEVTVVLTFVGNNSPLLPQIFLPLPGVGVTAVPPLPDDLTRRARVDL